MLTIKLIAEKRQKRKVGIRALQLDVGPVLSVERKGNSMYCQSCGARHGETDQKRVARDPLPYNSADSAYAPSQDLFYIVSCTDRGTLCQFCQLAPEPVKFYDTKTGELLNNTLSQPTPLSPDMVALRKEMYETLKKTFGRKNK